jgi:hypothetical protein
MTLTFADCLSGNVVNGGEYIWRIPSNVPSLTMQTSIFVSHLINAPLAVVFFENQRCTPLVFTI